MKNISKRKKDINKDGEVDEIAKRRGEKDGLDESKKGLPFFPRGSSHHCIPYSIVVSV